LFTSISTVAQVSNLLYRRLPVGRPWKHAARPIAHGDCGLEIRDPAYWKSALRDDAGRGSDSCPFVVGASHQFYQVSLVGFFAGDNVGLAAATSTGGRHVSNLNEDG
jgi:hypothetical protein